MRLKKAALALLAVLAAAVLSCCGGEAVTFLPGIDDIAENLRTAGYEVYEYDKLEIDGSTYDVMGINAVRGYEFIDLCLEADEATASLIADYYEDYFDSPEYVIRLTSHEAVICCGSEKPLRAAGITVAQKDLTAK